MLRLVSIVSLFGVVGCHASSPATRPGSPARGEAAHPAQPARPANLADQLVWLPRDTVSVARLRPDSIFVLGWLASQIGGPKPDCWQRIEKTIDAGYMFEVTTGASLLGFQSASERGDVERCIESAFPAGHLLHASLQRDGDTTLVETGAGRAALWWQGDGWVVAGAPDDLRQVRAAKVLGLGACAKRVLAVLPDRPIAYSSCNPMFEQLLGVPTRGWVLGASADDREGFRAEVTVFYASTEEAARARGALAPDKLPTYLPPSLRNWLGRLPSDVEGERLVIRVTLSKAGFDNLDVAALTRLTEEMKKSDRPDDELEKYWQQQQKAAEERKKAKGP